MALVPCASHPACEDVQWFLIPGTEPESWAALSDVASRVGVSPRALRQWMAPRRDTQTYDTSSRVRIVAPKHLPPDLFASRGRTFISASGLQFYLDNIRSRRGPKTGAPRLTQQDRDEISSALPLALPRTLVTDSHVSLDDRVVPRKRFVSEWLAPLARKLGYELRAPTPLPGSQDVNECTVKRKKQAV